VQHQTVPFAMTPEMVARLGTRREPRCEFLSVKYAVPAMRRAGGGSIIITSSVAGLQGSAGLAGYCATKGGVRLFAKAVVMECAAEGDGIRVNTVHPGVIDTPIWTKLSGSMGATCRLTRTKWPKPVCRSAGSVRPKTSQMVCYSSPLTRPTT
jgi:NAD(P)-dependent dehydrogenase (short-subunit alcohol dehydrogenase family)